MWPSLLEYPYKCFSFVSRKKKIGLLNYRRQIRNITTQLKTSLHWNICSSVAIFAPSWVRAVMFLVLDEDGNDDIDDEDAIPIATKFSHISVAASLAWVASAISPESQTVPHCASVKDEVVASSAGERIHNCLSRFSGNEWCILRNSWVAAENGCDLLFLNSEKVMGGEVLSDSLNWAEEEVGSRWALVLALTPMDGRLVDFCGDSMFTTGRKHGSRRSWWKR